jgi:hypothetical protein
MAKIYGYVQNKKSEAVLWHGSMTQENAEHFLTSRGLSVEDHTIVLDATGVDVQAMIDAYDNSIKTYSQKRKAEYNQLNQYEMMFDDKRDGTTTWVDKINEIKQRYPK